MNMIAKLYKRYTSMHIAAKAALWFMFCSVLQKSMSMITMPIFTRLMTTEQYGQFTMYNSWLQVITIVTTMRLNLAVFNKGMQKFRDDRDAYTSSMQTVTFCLALVVLLIYTLFQNQINQITEFPSIIMYAIIGELLVTPAIDFWTLRKRYEYVYKPVVIRTLLMTVLNAGIGLLAVFLSEEKGYARILSCVFVNVCFGIVLFTDNLRRGKKLFCWEYVKFAVCFNLPLLLHYLSIYVLDQFSKLMLQKLVDVSAVAIFGVACTLANILKIVTQSLNQTMVPWIHQKLEEKAYKTLDDTLFFLFAGVGCVVLAVSVLAPEIVFLFADAPYRNAIYCVPGMIFGLYCSFVYTLFANVEFFYDKNKFTMFISISGAALNIVLNYVGIRLFGYVAAAYVNAICYAVFTFAHYCYMTHITRPYTGGTALVNGTRLLALSAVLAVLTFGVLLLYEHALLRFGVLLVMCAAAFWQRKRILAIVKRIGLKKK